MSDYHLLETEETRLRVIHHFPVPGGSSGAGFTWKNLLLASGASGSTRLTEGTGPGQISTAERAQILTGDVLEIQFFVDLDKALTAGQTAAAIQAQATLERTAFLTTAQDRLRLYGRTA